MALYEDCAKLLRSSSQNMSKSLVSALAEHRVSPIFTRMGVFGTVSGRQLPAHVKRFPEDEDRTSSAHTIISIRSSLHTLMNEVHLLIFKATISKEPQNLEQSNLAKLEACQHQLIYRMMKWRTELAVSGLHPDDAVSTHDAQVSSILLMYHAITLAWLCTCFAATQSAWDQHNEIFESVIRHAELGLLVHYAPLDAAEPCFILEMGVIPPLYFVAIKCRSRRIRREALALIKRAPMRDNLWRTIPTAAIAAKVIEIEEAKLAPYVEASESEDLIPTEVDRISEMTLLPEGETGHPGEQQITMRWRRIAHSDQWHFTTLEHLCQPEANPEGAPAFTSWSILSSLSSNSRVGSVSKDEWIQWPSGV